MGKVCGTMKKVDCGELDYALEGRKLLEAVHLQSAKAPSRYSKIDAIWRHPQTGGVLYVGGEKMAKDREALREHKITRIVNCQDDDGRNWFETDTEMGYLRFLIGRWRTHPNVRDGGEGTWSLWEPLFAFVTQCLREGRSVLVHCLAGAHRAGTAAIGLLMILCQWGPEAATAAAQQLRPAIKPIGAFPELLGYLQQARECREEALQVMLPEEGEKAEAAA